jgi:hypothetical protein
MKCQYLDVNQKPSCGKRVFFGGHHCRKCGKFICHDHTDGQGDHKVCKNRTCYSQEEAARFSIDNMSSVHRTSFARFDSKPLFIKPILKKDSISGIIDSKSPGSSAEVPLSQPVSRKPSSFNFLRFVVFLALSIFLLNLYFPGRINYLNQLLQRYIDMLEILGRPYHLDYYFYYVFQFSRLIHVWLFSLLVATYFLFKLV